MAGSDSYKKAKADMEAATQDFQQVEKELIRKRTLVEGSEDQLRRLDGEIEIASKKVDALDKEIAEMEQELQRNADEGMKIMSGMEAAK